MTAQFQYTRLAHQAQAVENIASIFADVRFVAPVGAYENPVFVPQEAAVALQENITQTRHSSQISTGLVEINASGRPALSLDVLIQRQWPPGLESGRADGNRHRQDLHFY